MACVLQIVRLDAQMVPLLPLKSMNLMKIMCMFNAENSCAFHEKHGNLTISKARISFHSIDNYIANSI